MAARRCCLMANHAHVLTPAVAPRMRLAAAQKNPELQRLGHGLITRSSSWPNWPTLATPRHPRQPLNRLRSQPPNQLRQVPSQLPSPLRRPPSRLHRRYLRLLQSAAGDPHAKRRTIVPLHQVGVPSRRPSVQRVVACSVLIQL